MERNTPEAAGTPENAEGGRKTEEDERKAAKRRTEGCAQGSRRRPERGGEIQKGKRKTAAGTGAAGEKKKEMTAAGLSFPSGISRYRPYVSAVLRQLHSENCLRSAGSDPQPWEIAPVGHAPAQEPHSMQVSGSITYCPSPWEIAPTGHCPSQVPQLTQESLITYAIVLSSFK